MAQPIIVLDRLRKTFGQMTAVHDVSLSVAPGEIFGFLGANGAGKTTTMKMLCGLMIPTSGHGTIGGEDIWKERYSIRRKFGYVAQKFSLYPELSVEENLGFFAGASRVPGEEIPGRITELLALTDLIAKRRAAAGSLSGGMKQLLAVACALIHKPLLLFLDEPTAGLDPVHRQQMWDLLYDLSHDGTTIFVTTHYMDEAERCTELGFIHEGRLLAKSSPSKLKESFASRLLELQLEPLMPGLKQMREADGVLGVSLRSGRARLYAADAEKLLGAWQARWPFAGVRLLEQRWVEPDMEDVFKAYSQGYHQMLQPLS
ncbi:MAG TPA: ABC transporter ATP-binding protein [Chthoniobacteraceae bacterium]|jgi:ABC-2 type transport system ATP-binding protein|nr:ABC transporter ATP-binding protein [Chthoniobacteraceae bacterium]